MSRRVENLVVKNATIFKKNFSGVPDKYNKNGDRTFLLMIDDEKVALNMQEEGWNVKALAPREEGDSVKYYVAVKVAFEYVTPKIVLVTSKSKNILGEESVGQLDRLDLACVDVAIRPRIWEDDNGVEHIKAYLKTLYATLEEDEFAGDYEDDDEQEF